MIIEIVIIVIIDMAYTTFSTFLLGRTIWQGMSN